MPERWERELAKLRRIDMRETAVRERIDRGSKDDGLPPRRDRLIAGVVAAVVAVAAGAFAWQAFRPDDRRDVGGSTGGPPVLLVTLESNGVIDDGSEDPPRRIDTTIAYGDTRDESFTSTIAPHSMVEWVPVGKITRFATTLVAGGPVDIHADGDDPRVLIGDPSDWPRFERFSRIDALPDVPGEYVLVFEAEYPDGIARTARYVEVVAPDESPAPVTERPQPSPGPVGDVPGSVVVTLFAYGERSAELPTAIVTYGAERRQACTQDFRWTLPSGNTVTGVGTACLDDPATPVPPGTPISIAGSATSVMSTRTTTQFYEGDVGLVVSARWPEGEATFVVPLTVVLEGNPPDEVTLDCPPGDRVAFSPPSGARVLPGGSAYITGNLPGFEPGDVVEQMTKEGDGGAGGWDGTWQVVRDGSVIATVDVGSLNGVACRGSGIGGV